MALTFGPFDGSGPGSSITESFWRSMGRLWLATGVVKGELNELNTFADSTGMQVKVPSGTAWVEGQLCISDAATTLPLSAANGSNPRIDRVVLRKDNSAKTFSLLVLAGTAAASPAPPALTQTTTTWDLPLAQVLVPASATTIVSGNVTDERTLVRNADLSAPQVFTNKTLTAPNIQSFVNAQHAHTNAASGGLVAVPRYVMLAPGSFLPASSNGATLAQVSDSFELQFAPGATRNAVCRDAITVPPSYAGTPITFRIKGYSPSPSQSFAFNVLAAAVADGAAPYPALSTVVATTIVGNATSGTQITWLLTWTTGLPAAGTDLQFQLQRATDGASDTLHIRKVLIDFGS